MVLIFWVLFLIAGGGGGGGTTSTISLITHPKRTVHRALWIYLTSHLTSTMHTGYIGYVKRILELLQGFPTVSKMELEMRPARPDELDQHHVVRQVSKGRPSSGSQDDYSTWHSPNRGGSRGELGSPVGMSRS